MLSVMFYLVTVIGIPVYYHYCGGELEGVSYVLKSNSCCGEEDDDSDKAKSDCCKDENLILKSNPDVTIKETKFYALVKSVTSLPFIVLPFEPCSETIRSKSISVPYEFPPPKLQRQIIISTSVLRI